MSINFERNNVGRCININFVAKLNTEHLKSVCKFQSRESIQHGGNVVLTGERMGLKETR